MDEQVFTLLKEKIDKVEQQVLLIATDVKLLLGEKNKSDGKQLIISSLISVVVSIGIGILIAKVGK
jgi:hypothetical protein